MQGIKHNINCLYYINLLLIDCDAGTKKIERLPFKMWKKNFYLSGISDETVISTVGDLCASLQYAITFQICRRLQRAFSYCELQGLLPENSTLVSRGLELNKNITFAICYKVTNSGILVLFMIFFYYGNQWMFLCLYIGLDGNQFLLDNFSFHQEYLV